MITRSQTAKMSENQKDNQFFNNADTLLKIAERPPNHLSAVSNKDNLGTDFELFIEPVRQVRTLIESQNEMLSTFVQAMSNFCTDFNNFKTETQNSLRVQSEQINSLHNDQDVLPKNQGEILSQLAEGRRNDGLLAGNFTLLFGELSKLQNTVASQHQKFEERFSEVTAVSEKSVRRGSTAPVMAAQDALFEQSVLRGTGLDGCSGASSVTIRSDDRKIVGQETQIKTSGVDLMNFDAALPPYPISVVSGAGAVKNSAPSNQTQEASGSDPTVTSRLLDLLSEQLNNNKQNMSSGVKAVNINLRDMPTFDGSDSAKLIKFFEEFERCKTLGNWPDQILFSYSYDYDIV